MSVRKTESRIPEGLSPGDLGEAAATVDGHAVLLSFITAPLTVNRENVYVVMVTDAALAAGVHSYEWSFKENEDAATVTTTDAGETSYTPLTQGQCSISVRLLDAGSTELSTLSLTQTTGPLNPLLELLIVNAADQSGAGMGNPDAARELVNDHNPYYIDVNLQTPETGDSFKKYLFSTLSDGVIQRSAQERKYQLDQVAAAINTGDADYVAAIAPGLGTGAVRLSLAAMLLPPMPIPFTELPATPAEQAIADEALRQQLLAIPEESRIDWFNRLRFPKANIMLSGKLLEALRDKFFSGVSFDDVLHKMSGTMGDWLSLNYKSGPLHRD